MILNIHGFASNGLSKKSLILREHFEDKLISPSLSNIPTLAFDTCEQIIKCIQKSGQSVHLIGSSIGGFMSTYLSEKYNLKAVLINPAITPYEFTSFVGMRENYYDHSKFESTDEHRKLLKNYAIKTLTKPENFLVLLQKGDTLLDYKDAQKAFCDARLVIEEGGSHSFENFQSKLSMIEDFFA